MTGSISPRRSPARLLTTAAAVVAGALALPSAAGAANYCVGMTAAECGDGTVLSLQGALSVSQADPAADTIRIKDKGTPYVGQFKHQSTASTNTLTLKGVGATKPVLASDTADPALDVQVASLENLRVAVPAQFGSVGVRLDRSSTNDVDVAGGGNQSVGIEMKISSVVDSRVDVPGGHGVVMGGLFNLISGSRIDARRAVSAFGASFSVVRSRLHGVDRALVAQSSTGDPFEHVSTVSSVLTTSAADGVGIAAVDTPRMFLTRTTIASRSDRPTVASAALSVTASDSNVPVTIDSTVLAGYRTGVKRATTGSVSAPLTISHSEWDPANDQLSGAGAVTQTDNVHRAPLFVNRLGGDLRLRGSDPAIDRDPSSDAVHQVDLSGATTVDGDGDGDAHPDAGALEYRRRAPVLEVKTPSAGAPGVPLSFGASAADADGDAVTVAWSFGDGGSATGAAAAHSYSRAGTFEGTVTARDQAGVTTTRKFAVTVADAGGPAPDAGDRVAPAFAKLALTPRRLRASASRKLRLRVRLSERATVRITVKKRVTGRSVRLRRAIVLRLPAGTSSRRIGRALRRSRALRPGRYALTVTATDAAGNRSKAKRLRLTVLPRR